MSAASASASAAPSDTSDLDALWAGYVSAARQVIGSSRPNASAAAAATAYCAAAEKIAASTPPPAVMYASPPPASPYASLPPASLYADAADAAEYAATIYGNASNAPLPPLSGVEYMPPTLQPSTAAADELKSQERYIREIEKLLLCDDALEGAQVAGGIARPGSAGRSTEWAAERPGDAMALRQANRVLRAKVWHLQQQLQAAHGRCRRSETINAQWRDQHAKLRTREREQWQSLNAALQKLSTVDELQANNARLRGTMKERTLQLKASNERCAELEDTIDHLRGMLQQAMRSMRPEALAERKW